MRTFWYWCWSFTDTLFCLHRPFLQPVSIIHRRSFFFFRVCFELFINKITNFCLGPLIKSSLLWTSYFWVQASWLVHKTLWNFVFIFKFYFNVSKLLGLWCLLKSLASFLLYWTFLLRCTQDLCLIVDFVSINFRASQRNFFKVFLQPFWF